MKASRKKFLKYVGKRNEAVVNKLINEKSCPASCIEEINIIAQCCDECLKDKGHYKKDEKEKRFDKEDIEKINLLFDEENGFWKFDGCKLNRELRSETCLRHICYEYYKFLMGK